MRQVTAASRRALARTSNHGDLPFPDKAAAPGGEVPVQIQRTVRRGQYAYDRPAPGAERHPIAEGEFSIRDQYLSALAAARHTIYIEDQALGAPEVVEALHDALGRGVEVVVLLPVDPNEEMAAARTDPRTAPFWQRRAHLAITNTSLSLASPEMANDPGSTRTPTFTPRLPSSTTSGRRSAPPILAIARSMAIPNERSFWYRPTVTELRRDLLLEHLERDTAELDDVQALRLRTYRPREHRAARPGRMHGRTGLCARPQHVRLGGARPGRPLICPFANSCRLGGCKGFDQCHRLLHR